MALFKKARGSPFEVQDAWDVLQGSYEGRPILVRINSALRSVALHRGFEVHVGVAVRLNAPQEDGFPSPEEDRQLGSIEVRLQEEVEEPRRAVLALVLTTSGMREFVLYAETRGWIEEWARRFVESFPTHEIQVMARTDPDWLVYRDFLKT